MTKQEVLERLCALCNDVARDVVDFPSNPADCFCGMNDLSPINFQFDERIIDYIETVVYRSGITKYE
jgi:hypothetical protein